MSVLPENDKARKNTPIFKMITRYFPKALREVTLVCVANNVRYSPDREPSDINWARGKSPDQLGSLFRHIMERTVDGKIFEHTSQEVAKSTGIMRMYVLAEAAWRALAALELEIEEVEAAEKPEKWPTGTTTTGPGVAAPPAPSTTEPAPPLSACACGKTLGFHPRSEYVTTDDVSHTSSFCTPGGVRCPKCRRRTTVGVTDYPNVKYCQPCEHRFAISVPT